MIIHVSGEDGLHRINPGPVYAWFSFRSPGRPECPRPPAWAEPESVCRAEFSDIDSVYDERLVRGTGAVIVTADMCRGLWGAAKAAYQRRVRVFVVNCEQGVSRAPAFAEAVQQGLWLHFRLQDPSMDAELQPALVEVRGGRTGGYNQRLFHGVWRAAVREKMGPPGVGLHE